MAAQLSFFFNVLNNQYAYIMSEKVNLFIYLVQLKFDSQYTYKIYTKYLIPTFKNLENTFMPFVHIPM